MFETIINGVKIKLPCEIQKDPISNQPDIIKNDKYIVILTENCKKDGRNVFVFNNTGKLLWQIGEKTVRKYAYWRERSSPQVYTVFTSAKFMDDGTLLLGNTFGFHIYVNPENGKILKDEFVK